MTGIDPKHTHTCGEYSLRDAMLGHARFLACFAGIRSQASYLCKSGWTIQTLKAGVVPKPGHCRRIGLNLSNQRSGSVYLHCCGRKAAHPPTPRGTPIRGERTLVTVARGGAVTKGEDPQPLRAHYDSHRTLLTVTTGFAAVTQITGPDKGMGMYEFPHPPSLRVGPASEAEENHS